MPGLGRFPGGGQGNPFQYSRLENPHGQRSLVGYSPWSCKELDMTEQLILLVDLEICISYIFHCWLKHSIPIWEVWYKEVWGQGISKVIVSCHHSYVLRSLIYRSVLVTMIIPIGVHKLQAHQPFQLVVMFNLLCKCWTVKNFTFKKAIWEQESTCNVGGLGLIPGLERSPGGGHGNPLHYSCLENPHR